MHISIILIVLGNTFAKPCNDCNLNIHKCKLRAPTTTSTTTTTTSTTTTTTSTTTTTTSTTTTTTSTTTTTPTTSTTQPTQINNTTNTKIKVNSGTNATLTYFTDTITQCYGVDIPLGNGVAVNPLLLGFTLEEWNNNYANADPSEIPWCGKMMNITVNGNTFSSRIVDTCNPGVDGEFIDPNTGKIVGGRCDYDNVIDLYGDAGLQFLQSTVGDDFYQGALNWVIY
jgi:hypothetical protein